MDETTLSLHPPLRACWTKRGEQPLVPAPGTQQTHHIFAAYNWADDTVTWTTSDKKNSQAFIAFLEHLFIDQFPTGRHVLVLDNAPYHTSGESLAALSLFEHRVLIFWLPKYCSLELNPIERFWRHLKDTICVNKLFPSLEDLIDAARLPMNRQNDLEYSDRFAFVKSENVSHLYSRRKYHEHRETNHTIGDFEFVLGGYPTKETTQKLFDALDFQRACQAYLDFMPAMSMYSLLEGQEKGWGCKECSDNLMNLNRTMTVLTMSSLARKLLPGERRTGFKPFPARVGLPTFACTVRWSLSSIKLGSRMILSRLDS